MHTHDHEHAHEHSHGVTPEVLLAHMAEHNRAHLRELEEIAGQLTGEAAELVKKAAVLYEEGNSVLDLAIALQKQEEQ